MIVMKRWIQIVALVFVSFFMGGCATSNSPVGGLRQDGLIANDLKAAAFNLDQAIAIGVLPEDDPAAGCVRGVLSDLGLDGTAAPEQSFMPKRDGLISIGAVLYIRAQQVKKARASRITLPQDCMAIIGRIVIDAAKVAGRGARSLIPGGGLISIIRGR